MADWKTCRNLHPDTIKAMQVAELRKKTLPSTAEEVENYKKLMREKYEAELNQSKARAARNKQLEGLLSDVSPNSLHNRQQSQQPTTASPYPATPTQPQVSVPNPHYYGHTATTSPTTPSTTSAAAPKDDLDALLGGLDDLIPPEEKEAKAMKAAYEQYKLRPQHMTTTTQWKNQYY